MLRDPSSDRQSRCKRANPAHRNVCYPNQGEPGHQISAPIGIKKMKAGYYRQCQKPLVSCVVSESSLSAQDFDQS